MPENKNKFIPRGQRKIKTGRYLAFSLLILLAIAVVYIVGVVVLYRPEVSNPRETDSGTPAVTTIPTSSETESDEPTETKEPAETSAHVPAVSSSVSNVRKKGFYTFLIAGTDRISMSTDVIMLASMDCENNIMNIVQIPRDMYINREVGGYKSITRINSVFAAEYNACVNDGMNKSEAKKRGMESLTQVLEEHLAIEIDRYALIGIEGFRKIVDAVGGIEYNVPFDMDYEDPEQDLYIHLKAGAQTLYGEHAEQFIRYRSGYAMGDLGRVGATADFIRAAATQISRRFNLGVLITTAVELSGEVTTSMSIEDIQFFVRKAYAIGESGIITRVIGGAPVQNDSGVWAYYSLNRKSALAMINEALNVYTTDITEAEFDARRFFTDDKNASHKYLSDYYYS